MIFKPSDKLITTFAKIEVDLPYISIPTQVFEQLVQNFDNYFDNSMINCTERMCSFLMACDQAKLLF